MGGKSFEEALREAFNAGVQAAEDGPFPLTGKDYEESWREFLNRNLPSESEENA